MILKRLFTPLVLIFPFMCFGSESYVIGQLLGQMGNNLFQVAAASALAWDHGTEAYFPELVFVPSLYQHIFSRCKVNPPSTEVEFVWREPLYCYHPISFAPKMTISGYLQSPKYFEHHRDKILDLLAPTARDLRYIQKKYKWLIDHPYSIGVQIRYYIDDVDGTIFVQYGEDFLKHAMAQFPPEALFIVSSNNLDFARQNISGENVIFLEGEPHYIDFYLLSLCKHNIITNSSFGWWAAWLNQNLGQRVVCPDFWFNGLDTKDLCPDHWEKVAGKRGRISDPESYR